MNDSNIITVNESPVPEQIGTAFRTFLIALAGYMAGKGWIDAGLASAAVPVITLVIPAAWAQARTAITHRQRVTMANVLPDALASTK